MFKQRKGLGEESHVESPAEIMQWFFELLMFCCPSGLWPVLSKAFKTKDSKEDKDLRKPKDASQGTYVIDPNPQYEESEGPVMLTPKNHHDVLS